MTNYRKIYEDNFGIIPKGYHIHHKDGNKNNNTPENLMCVSPEEHYKIHYNQGDYGACWSLLVTGHMKLSSEQRAELSRKQMYKLVQEQKHPWQTRPDGSSLTQDRLADIKEIVSRTQKQLVDTGEHHFLRKNRNINMEIKRSKTVKKKYENAEFKEFMRQHSLNRTWKLSPEKAKKVGMSGYLFTKDNANVCKNTVWINNGIKNKRIKQTEQIPEGYIKGRLFVSKNKKGIK